MSTNNGSWTFLSNHSHVMLCIFQNDEIRIRDIAEKVGVTERAVSVIISDLVENKYISIIKKGRRNSYKVNVRGKLRHPLESNISIGQILNLFAK